MGFVAVWSPRLWPLQRLLALQHVVALMVWALMTWGTGSLPCRTGGPLPWERAAVQFTVASVSIVEALPVVVAHPARAVVDLLDANPTVLNDWIDIGYEFWLDYRLGVLALGLLEVVVQVVGMTVAWGWRGARGR